ncbi:helix-turn-helix domain-containing protein [Klebsiella pneumoniae]|nr:helix-turn-helix domain-containing protein [Klebsiella pneumoniae]
MKEHSVLSKFWGDEATSMGWTGLPNTLLILQSDLGISSTEMCVLMNILMHQWPQKEKNISFPSIELLAKRIGVSERSIQRTIRSLEKKGFISILPTERSNQLTKGANIYDSSRLKVILNEKSIEAKKKNQGIKKQIAGIKMPFICRICLTSKANNVIEFRKSFGFTRTIAGDIPNKICKKCANKNDIF